MTQRLSKEKFGYDRVRLTVVLKVGAQVQPKPWSIGDPLRRRWKGFVSASLGHPNIEPARANTVPPLRTWLEP
jgi:hypothetical protein